MKVIISGGGTGGHIFPAIAIANALKSKVKDIDILFIGAKGRMEMEKIPAAGYKIKGLWISGLQRRITAKNFLFPLKVISSLFIARKIIADFKPDVVVGVGGYASGPTLRAATTNRIPTLIQEQNSYPGITNKILASKVNKICVAYKGMEKYFPASKIVITGNPVRQNIVNNAIEKQDAIIHFELNANKKTILVIGGSLGARTINESIKLLLPLIENNNYQLIWQTGKFFYELAKNEVVINNYKNIKVFEFITEMDYAYSSADIIISRAGAIAISELCIVGKPVILIPSPNVAEDHQTKNAMALVNNNAAILVKDIDAKNNLKDKLFQLLEDVQQQKRLAENIKSLAYPDAADTIADVVISLIKK
jgi:UDP-N-acetylglucosamine--N-acetylmuramyl-(pentapeptide) pyrophosphoryl-undecaprenol N-acetylglucosamine transferase